MQEPNRTGQPGDCWTGGIIPSSGNFTPMGMATSLRHKKKYQKKQANKALADHGCRPNYKDV